MVMVTFVYSGGVSARRRRAPLRGVVLIKNQQPHPSLTRAERPNEEPSAAGSGSKLSRGRRGEQRVTLVLR